MKLIVFGASHGVGRATVEAALAAGHTVTAFSRNPARIGLEHPRLKLAAGDVLDPEVVNQAVAGHEAAICTLGLPTLRAIGPPLTKRSYVLSRGTENIIAALMRAGGKRFICETAIGAGESKADCTLLARLAFRLGLKWLFHEKDVQERLTRTSSLDWTIVRPSALTNGPYTGSYLAREHLKIGILSNISRADVADFMVKALADPQAIGKTWIVSYPPRFGDSVRWLKNYR